MFLSLQMSSIPRVTTFQRYFLLRKITLVSLLVTSILRASSCAIAIVAGMSKDKELEQFRERVREPSHPRGVRTWLRHVSQALFYAMSRRPVLRIRRTRALSRQSRSRLQAAVPFHLHLCPFEHVLHFTQVGFAGVSVGCAPPSMETNVLSSSAVSRLKTGVATILARSTARLTRSGTTPRCASPAGRSLQGWRRAGTC